MPLRLVEQLNTLTDTVLADLGVVWDTGSPQDAVDLLHEVLPPFLDRWTEVAAALAADWYDNLRDEQNIAGSYTATVPDLGDQGAGELAGWAGEALLAPEPDWELARSRVEGGAQRRIANAARTTVMTSSVEDPKARGWKRVVRPGACGFCRMLAGRNYAYKTKESSTFGSHDHCSCAAVPGWADDKKVKVRDFTPSTKDITPAQRQATYRWIKENLPTT